MKKQLIFGLLWLCPALFAQGKNAVVKFDYDMTGVVRCSASITTNCLDHFETGLFNSGVITSPTSIPLPAGSGQVTGITGSFPVSSNFVVVAVLVVAKDGSGNRLTSAPAIAIGFSGVSNFTLIIQ